MTTEPDPKGLIRESYRIERITEGECRSIFLDWAIGVPGDADPRVLIRQLLDRYQSANPDHPMTGVLVLGLDDAPLTGRRGGRAARRRDGSV